MWQDHQLLMALIQDVFKSQQYRHGTGRTVYSAATAVPVLLLNVAAVIRDTSVFNKAVLILPISRCFKASFGILSNSKFNWFLFIYFCSEPI